MPICVYANQEDVDMACALRVESRETGVLHSDNVIESSAEVIQWSSLSLSHTHTHTLSLSGWL